MTINIIYLSLKIIAIYLIYKQLKNRILVEQIFNFVVLWSLVVLIWKDKAITKIYFLEDNTPKRYSCLVWSSQCQVKESDYSTTADINTCIYTHVLEHASISIEIVSLLGKLIELDFLLHKIY